MTAPATVAAALQAARLTIAMSEARLLLGTLLEKNLAWLEAHRDDALSAEAATRFADWVARRAAGEPVAYLLGRREFYGRDFTVGPAVLIPRHETELLVELALGKMAQAQSKARSVATASLAPDGERDRVRGGEAEPIRVLDLGTGSGCIALTLALEAPAAQVTAVDVSAEALALAQGNAAALGAPVSFALGSWFEPVAEQKFDLIVSNPPYICAGDPHLSQGDVRFEPASALASGATGLDDIRRIAREAPAHLHPGGWLLFEHGYDQELAMVGVFAEAGFRAVEQHRDLAGIVRVTLGQWLGANAD